MCIVKRSVLVVGLVAAAMGAAVHVGSAAAAAQAQQRQTSFPGKSLFSTYCASCHGATAKGDGPFAASLRKRPSDLTQLAKLNAGTFPAEAVAKSIDGREMAVAHGADMPVWGDAFSRTREDSDPESVRLKIKSIVQYIESLQERPVTHE